MAVVAAVEAGFLPVALPLLLAREVPVVEEMGQIALLVQTAQQTREGAVAVAAILMLVAVVLAAQAVPALSSSSTP
jgi:hypothetical protein